MYITIGGTAGSGKSTLAKMLAKEFNWPYISVGSIRRKMAEERGMTLAEFNELGEKDPFTDVDVDKRVKEEAMKLPDAIIEGRVQYHFIPDSTKIFVKTDLETASKRIFKDLQKKGREVESEFKTVDEVRQSIIERQLSDERRYKKYYDLDVFDEKNYDIILDTTHQTGEETLTEVLTLLRK